MGTNYYLEPVPAVCPTCGHDATRYVHIGKSSFGWVFTWAGYRPPNPDDPYDWSPNPLGVDLSTPTLWLGYLRTEVGAGRKLIRDEYGDVIPLDEFVARVEAKRGPLKDGRLPSRAADPKEWTAEGDDMIFGEFS